MPFKDKPGFFFSVKQIYRKLQSDYMYSSIWFAKTLLMTESFSSNHLAYLAVEHEQSLKYTKTSSKIKMQINCKNMQRIVSFNKE